MKNQIQTKLKILGVDTATDVLGVAIVEDRHLKAEMRSNLKRAHAERLIPSIEMLLCALKLNIRDLNGIAISIGPGSFTGLRIGLAAVKGLAFASGLPVVTVASLDVLAYQAKWWQFEIRPLIRAQADEVYTATYNFEQQKLNRKSDYSLIDLKDLKSVIKHKSLLLPSGIKNIHNFIPNELKTMVEIASPEDSMTSGFTVALLGFEKFFNNEFENLDALEPFYLKNFKAKQKIGI